MDEKNESRPPVRRKRKKKLTAFGVLLYTLFVIGTSTLLAGAGWVWANDVFALNKEYSTAIITVPHSYPEEYNFSQVVDVLHEQGLISYKSIFHVYAAFSSARDKISPGTYQLDTNMDYHALVTNMGSRSASRQSVKVTIPEG